MWNAIEVLLVFAIAASNFIFLFVRNFARATLQIVVPEHYEVKYNVPTPRLIVEAVDFMQGSRTTTGILQTFVAPILITGYFRWDGRVTNKEEMHLTIMFAVQLVQSTLMLLAIFGSCGGDRDYPPKNVWESFGRRILSITVAVNLTVGLVFAIAYLVIIGTEDLEHSVFKLWFYVYCFI